MVHELIEGEEHEVHARVDADRKLAGERQARAVAELQVLYHGEFKALLHRHAVERVVDRRAIVGHALADEHGARIGGEHAHGVVHGFGEAQNPPLSGSGW